MKTNAVNKYIYFYENFDAYSLGDFFAQSNPHWKPPYFPGTIAITPQIMDHPLNGRYLKLALNNPEGAAHQSGAETKTLQNAFNQGFFNSAWHWNPQTGLERNRWAVISELFLTDAAVAPIDHTLTAMRAVETGFGTSRFGVYLRPGNAKEGALQFSNPASHYEGCQPLPCETVGFLFTLGEQLKTDGSVRYALTFEEWEQADGFWVLRHWKGTVYKVNTSTLPWVYTPLGSLEAAESPDGRVYDEVGVWVAVPPISGSELLFGLVNRTLDVDLQLFYAAYYSY